MGLDLGGGYRLRHATEEDRDALEMVCLKTGDSGKDATAREDDPRLLGLYYAVPYQVHSPEYSFVVDGPNGVAGYVLGTLDSAAFYDWARDVWLPSIAATVPEPVDDETEWRGSDGMRWLIHHPEFTYPAALHPFPAHGHIDLLPEAQGRGFGRRALEHLIGALRRDGAPGMHLGVGASNTNAIAFYEKLGFQRITLPEPTPGAVWMATTL